MIKSPVKENFNFNTDYNTFDSDAFYNSFYSDNVSNNSDLLQFRLDTLSEIYNSGKIKGDNLLDLGTGPTIYNLVSAARHVPNIYLSDFCENNRESLWRWLTNDPRAHDLSHFFQYIDQKEGLGEPLSILQDDMRSRIRGIFHCDMTKKNPLYPSIFPQFDVISTSLCLCCVPTSTREAYESAVKNVASLLKDGGWIIYIDVLNETFYQFGEQKYTAVTLDKEFIVNTFRKADLHVDFWKHQSLSSEESNGNPVSDHSGMFCLTAQKKESVK